LNWHPVATLPATVKDYTAEKGYFDFWIESQVETPPPWLDVQFITKHEAMMIPN
jgi:hypothetical protein